MDQNGSNFIYPSNVSSDGLCTEQQIDQWRNEGYILVNGLFQSDMIDSASRELYNIYSSEEGQKAKDKKDFGGFEFPFQLGSALNDITLHPSILKTAATLLKTSDIRLTQADAWVKFHTESTTSDFDNRDQRMHIDGWNHTLVVPADWHTPASVAMIIYLSDSSETGGETAVVPREGEDDIAYKSLNGFLNTPGAGFVPWINDKARAEEYYEKNDPDVFKFRKSLYNREKKAKFTKGSVLFYRHDTWHRGTPLTVKNSFRVVLNLSFRRADAPWFQHWSHGWARSMYSPEQTLERLIGKLTVDQRSALGFPRPGDSYWNKSTLEAVTLRYKCFGFDPTPYQL